MENDIDDSELDYSSAPVSGFGQEDSSSELVLALLENAIDKTAIAELEQREAFCLVMEAPSAAWARAIKRTVRKLGGWDSCVLGIRKPGARSDDDASSTVAEVLGRGGRVLGVAQHRSFLPSALIVAADRIVTLGMPTAEVLSVAIAGVTGSPPVEVPTELGRGLDFDEIASCLRRNATAAECVDRLKRASELKSSSGQVPQDVPPIEALCGFGEAKVWALDLLADLRAVERGEITMSQCRARVVLAGPPGVGKTTFAKSLARSAGLPLIATGVGEWFTSSSGYLDAVLKQIDEVFASANAMGRAVVLFDELESVPNRASMDGRHREYWTPVVTHLLTQLDGVCGASSNLIVIGATNHPEKLDSALIRPGRLSRIVRIELPDADAMVGILRQHLQQDLVDEDLKSAAELAVGGTGAMVAEWVMMARRAARTENRPMRFLDLINAIAPPEGRSFDELERISIHEAGHAVIVHFLGIEDVASVSIVRRGEVGGATIIKRNQAVATRARLEAQTVALMSGRAAEEVFFGIPSGGAGGSADSDLAQASRLVGLLHLGLGLGESLLFRADMQNVMAVLRQDSRLAALVEGELQTLYSRSVDLVLAHRSHVRAVATELIEHRHIGRSKFLEIISKSSSPTRRTREGGADNE